MKEYKVKDCDKEILQSIEKLGGFGMNYQNSLKGMGFYEFSLEELNLPSAEVLLEAVNKIKNLVGLQGWMSNGEESERYKGFSLTYNPEFLDTTASIYHQSFGSKLLSQKFGRIKGKGNLTESKNTYYDSFSFRYIPPIINDHLECLLQNFRLSLLRSRAAWFYGLGLGEQKDENWHVDEQPTFVLRLNIPLQTSKEHVIDIVGKDEYGNELNIVNKHLEVGKAYMWNTRIPHRITFKELCKNPSPRIHLVLGFCPWFDFDKLSDSFKQNHLWGKDIDEIVKNKLFLK